MAQLQQQLPDASWISVPFKKFSYNTGRVGSKMNSWTHVGPCNDLNLVIRDARVIDSQGNYNTRVMMKVSKGAEVLETQDLGHIVACYKQWNPVHGGTNIVQLATRPPDQLALAFPISDNTARRCQFRFLTEADFKKVLAVLEELGLVPRLSATTTIKPSAQCSSTSLSGLSTSSNSTLTVTSDHLHRSAPKAPIIPLNFERQGSLLSQSFSRSPYDVNALYERNSRLLPSSVNHPGNAPNRIQNPPTISSSLGEQHQLESSCQSSFVAQTAGEAQRNEKSQQTVSKLPTIQNSEPYSDYPIVTSHQSGLDGLERAQSIHRSHYFSKPIDSRQLTPSTGNLESPILDDGKDLPISTLSAFRPQSAPTYSDLQDIFIPPRRELPPSYRAKAPSTSSTAQSPLPKPTPIDRQQSASTPLIPTTSQVRSAQSFPHLTPSLTKKALVDRNDQSSSKPAESSSLSRHHPRTTTTKSLATITEEQVSPLATKSAIIPRPASASSVLESKAYNQRKRPTSAQLLNTIKRAKLPDCGELPISTAAVSTATSRDAEISNNTPQLSELSVPPHEYFALLEDSLRGMTKYSAPREVVSTLEYHNATQEERDMLLSNFICQNLQDSKFIQLGTDMERCWRRIGLEKAGT